MDPTAAFRELEPFNLTGVTVSNQGLGNEGLEAATTDMELEYRGLKCVGKMIIELLLMEGDLIQQFKQNCHQLSKLRHPNIAQFLGVFFQEGISAPVLVMEFLPINLSFCIDQYRILPKEIRYSILHDVALGLCYLHSQIPPLFHGNLSSNTVLLDSNMTAKLSDLGTLSLTPLPISHVTQPPEMMVYFPPEAMAADPAYDVSTDEYSYGILMIHVFSGKWPDLQSGVTEADRRDKFLKAIGNDHPLKELILRCINVDSQQRAHTNEIVQELSKMVSRFPVSFGNRLDMLRTLEEDQHSHSSIAQVKDEMVKTEQQFEAQKQEIEKLKVENQQLKMKIAQNGELLDTTIQALQQAQKRRQDKLKTVQNKTSDQDVRAPTESANTNREIKQANASDDQKETLGASGMTNTRLTRTSSATGGVFSPPPIYVGKFDFEALSERDMNFKAGMKMFIIDTSEGNWWYARNMETLEEGYVPTNYISEAGAEKNVSKDIRLVQKIGTGPCFEVWEGLWNQSVPIAIKKTTPKVNMSANFLKELEIMKSLHHPNLISFYLSCTNDGLLCIIMELMKHGTLLDYLRQNRQSLTPQHQISAAEQVAGAMAYLEQKEFPHQSLAARNVMMTSGKVCKVADSGTVRLIGEGEDGKEGPEFSPRWTAPEAIEDGTFSIKSDVWSYGTLLYEIVTFGKFPYHGLTNKQVTDMIKQGSRIACPRGCQEKLYDIMLSCWARLPDDRPTFEKLKWLMSNYFNENEEQDVYVQVYR